MVCRYASVFSTRSRAYYKQRTQALNVKHGCKLLLVHLNGNNSAEAGKDIMYANSNVDVMNCAMSSGWNGAEFIFTRRQI